ncbi:MAG: PilZ domain-containing protein [Pyrinomonadaceae bacterium]
MLPNDDSNNSGFLERRETDRKKLIVEVYFEGGDATGIANTTDVSLGGLFMKTNARLEVGQSVAMRLTVGGNPLNLQGIIAFTEEGTGVGVSFTDLSEEKKSLLQREFDLQ